MTPPTVLAPINLHRDVLVNNRILLVPSSHLMSYSLRVLHMSDLYEASYERDENGLSNISHGCPESSTLEAIPPRVIDLTAASSSI